tara:strand:+ start:207 stop:848 length:642 start_codon:yes stop_codon:yes gene_type:complete
MKSRWGAFSEALSERASLLLGFGGVVFSAVPFFVARDAKVPLWLMCFSSAALLVLIFILIHAMKLLALDRTPGLPDVRTTLFDQSDPEKLILLLDPSDLFGIFSRVSVYSKDKVHGFERLIGYGHVLNVQGDRKIQVLIEEWTEVGLSHFEALKNQAADALDTTIVRPSAPKPENRRPIFDNDAISQLMTSVQARIEAQKLLKDQDDEPTEPI